MMSTLESGLAIVGDETLMADRRYALALISSEFQCDNAEQAEALLAVLKEVSESQDKLGMFIDQ